MATLLSPKAPIFAFVVFPPLRSLAEGVVFGGAFVAAVAVTGLGWLWLGGALGRFGATRAPRMLPRVSGVALGVIAGMVVASVARR